MTDPLADTRILIVAENASARFGGEAILPLHIFTGLARRGRDVHLIAHARNREELTQAHPDLAARMSFVEDTRLHRLVWHLGKPFPGAIRDHLFGNLLGLVNAVHLRAMIRARFGAVDLIHQPIPVSPAAPSAIHGFGVPVVIGPMNGGMGYPPGWEDMEGRSSRLFMTLGRGLAGLINRLIPGKRRAALLLVANRRTARALPVRHDRVRLLVENGVDLTTWTAPPEQLPHAGFRLVFMGRLVTWKALDITLEALAKAPPELGITLDILGDGPERGALEALARQRGLAGKVRFHGFRPQAECAALLVQSDALILNSLRECGGAVVLEAMAMGLPVIASDWGGPADYLDEGCGVLVHPSPRASFSMRLAAAIARLASDPVHARNMGRNGQAKVRAEFDWVRKIEQIEGFYAEALGSQARSG